MRGEAVPVAWSEGMVFPEQPNHSDHCVDEAISQKKPQKDLKMYSPRKN